MKKESVGFKSELSFVCTLLSGVSDISLVYPRVQPAMLFSKELRLIYRAAIALFDNGKAMDFTLLEHEMRCIDDELFGEINGISYVNEGLIAVNDDVHIVTYADLIVAEYQRNSLRLLAMELNAKCSNPSVPVEDIIQLADTKLTEIAGLGLDSTSTRQISQIGEDVLKRHMRMLAEGITSVGIPTGLAGVDSIIGGFLPGEVATLSALTSHGKTAISLFMALKIAISGKAVYMISLEMSMEQLYGRILLSLTNISPENLRQHGLTAAEIEVVKTLNETKLKELPLYIDYIASARTEDIRSKVKLARKRNQCDLLVLDYINQMDMGGGSDETLATSLGNAMKKIKDLAVEENIPALVLAQMNREIDKRTDNSKHKLSDLRDSGVLEQASDIVMFINRPELQGKVKDNNGESLVGVGFITVLKNRNGSTGITQFRYNNTMTRISDY